jgi:hypothetical protein
MTRCKEWPSRVCLLFGAARELRPQPSQMAKPFPALPGFYATLFLHIEPLSTLFPAFLIWFFPGATWFFNELMVGGRPETSLDSRTTMAIWQLASCYGLLGMLSSFVFRAVRDALPNDPAAQERIIGASFKALAIADVSLMSHKWRDHVNGITGDTVCILPLAGWTLLETSGLASLLQSLQLHGKS